MQEQVEGAEQLVPAGESESESELSTTEIELNISESETSGGPLLFLEASTDNEDLSSEKQMKIATEKVNLALQNLDTRSLLKALLKHSKTLSSFRVRNIQALV